MLLLLWYSINTTWINLFFGNIPHRYFLYNIPCCEQNENIPPRFHSYAKINTVWRINDRTINGIICNLSENFVPLCCERTIEEFHYNKRASKTETCVYSKFPWITKFPALMLAASINVVHLVHTENLRTKNVFSATAWNTQKFPL